MAGGLGVGGESRVPQLASVCEKSGGEELFDHDDYGDRSALLASTTFWI